MREAASYLAQPGAGKWRVIAQGNYAALELNWYDGPVNRRLLEFVDGGTHMMVTTGSCVSCP